MITYPIKDINELNAILQDPMENQLVASILWLAQCTVVSTKIRCYVPDTMKKLQKQTLGEFDKPEP